MGSNPTGTTNFRRDSWEWAGLQNQLRDKGSNPPPPANLYGGIDVIVASLPVKESVRVRIPYITPIYRHTYTTHLITVTSGVSANFKLQLKRAL